MAADCGCWELTPGYWLVRAGNGAFWGRKFIEGTREDAERCQRLMQTLADATREEVDRRWKTAPAAAADQNGEGC